MASTAGVDEESQPLPPRRTPEWYHALGFKNPWGLHAATFYEKLTFGWGAPLLDKGSYGQITEEMADALPPPEDEAPLRAQQFADCYDHCQVCICAQVARHVRLSQPTCCCTSGQHGVAPLPCCRRA